MFGFCWNCLKSDCLTSLGGYKWFLDFLTLFNPSQPEKNEKFDFLDSDNPTGEPQVQNLSTYLSLESLSNTL